MPAPKNLASYEQFHHLLFDRLTRLTPKDTLQWEYPSFKDANYVRLRFYGFLRTMEALHQNLIEREARKGLSSNTTLLMAAERKLHDVATARGFGLYIEHIEAGKARLSIRHKDAAYADFTNELLAEFMASQSAQPSVTHEEVVKAQSHQENLEVEDLFRKHYKGLNIPTPYSPSATPADAMRDVVSNTVEPTEHLGEHTSLPPDDTVSEYTPYTDPYA